jgi:hypothetical protein
MVVDDNIIAGSPIRDKAAGDPHLRANSQPGRIE